MSYKRKLKERKNRRRDRVRERVVRAGRVRLSVFRSLNHIYGQLIDDEKGITLASSSSLLLKPAEAQKLGDKKAVAHETGKRLAEKAREQGVESVVLDRGAYLYHGRVRAFADGMRAGGITI